MEEGGSLRLNCDFGLDDDGEQLYSVVWYYTHAAERRRGFSTEARKVPVFRYRALDPDDNDGTEMGQKRAWLHDVDRKFSISVSVCYSAPP